MAAAFRPIPDWFSPLTTATSVAVADVTGNGTPDLLVLAVGGDHPVGQPDTAAFRVGHDLDATGAVTAGWTGWLPVPDWPSTDTVGAGIAVADVTGNGLPDVVVLAIDNRPELNRGLYRIGFDLDATSSPARWSPWLAIPWFCWGNQGGGIALADLGGNGRPDVVVMTVDDGPEQNRGIYRVGRDLSADGTVTGWGDWHDMPDWFSWINQGGGIAVADLDGSGRPDIVVFGIDNPPGQNQAFYRIAHDVDADGIPAGSLPGDPQAGWSSLLGVNNWTSWENQTGGIAVAALGGSSQLIVLAADASAGGSTASYAALALTETPSVHGQWTVLPFNSEVLAIHAALLHTGQVLFFSGSGNNTARVADPTFGNVADGMYTSVVWDPQAPLGNNFTHPPTIHRQDGRPFDFFCGGDTFLADGRVLSVGGTQDYNAGNDLGQRDCAIFDPVTATWTHAATMPEGRWYPQLLLLPDGHVLTVSGKNETNGELNGRFEMYDPAQDQWIPHAPPDSPDFTGLPLYAHLILLADGRVFFTGARMDDPRPQGPGIMAFSPDRTDFQPVRPVVDPRDRNQSSSVLLPPAQQQRVMVIGGGPADDATSATGATEIADLTQPVPAFAASMPLSLPRIHLNAVLLPDRTVFVSGGAIIHEESGVEPVARLQAEIYDPAENTWHPAASASVVRMYHSVALLMPDGSVMTASGNPPPYGQRAPWQPPQPNEELTIEMYSPPYLFASTAAPTIGQVTQEWGYGQTIDIPTPQAPNLLWCELIRAGVTTHAFDNSQRLVDLPITARGGDRVTVQTPLTATIAPPGWYLLFIVDQDRIPSKSVWIQLTA
jgi:hypothetical protein